MTQTENLFSYGTLRNDEVQLELFGRTVVGKPDALIGYRLITIEVQDQSFVAHSGATQRNIQFTGNTEDVVEGVVLMVTQQDLERADAYEPAEYRRIRAGLRSGADAWVYLSR